MSLLRVPAQKQSPSHCGPASLSMIFAYYGKKHPEKEIAKKAKTTLARGTSPKNLLLAAQAFGFTGAWHKNGTMKNLEQWYKKGVPTLVNWFSVTEGHYSVVVKVNKTHIVLLDPYSGKYRTFTHETFMGIWFDFPSAWIKKASQVRIRHFLPLVPTKRSSSPSPRASIFA